MASRLEPAQLARAGTEHGEQSALFCWAALPETRAELPDAMKLFAVNNNAGVGDAIRGARAKMAGVRPGVADTMLPVARHGCNGLFLEIKQRKFKTRKEGGLSADQIAFRDQVRRDGFGYAVAYGWEEGAAILREYLTP